MKMKRFFSMLLLLVLLFTVLSPAAYAVSDDEEIDEELVEAQEYARLEFNPTTGFPVYDNFSVDGTAAILCALDDDMILYSQDIDTRVYPASLAKVMTCLVAVENGNLDDRITVTNDMMYDDELDAFTGYITTGEIYTLRQLLYLIMLPSVNEACNVVAEYISGSRSAFIQLLNDRATELGCTGTHFSNTHGLHNEQEYTTVRDLMLITKAALAIPELQEICYATRYDMPETNVHEARYLYTNNYLVDTYAASRYYYAAAKGVKAGYTRSAGRCLITTGSDGTSSYLAIVMGCDTQLSTDGSEYILYSFVEGKSLLQYGFEYFEYSSVLSPDTPVGKLPVENGMEEYAIVEPLTTAGVTLPLNYRVSDITVELNGTIQAPAEPGDVVGTATIYYRNHEIGTVDVTPIHSVTAYDEEAAEQQAMEKLETESTHHTSYLIVFVIMVFSFLFFYLIAFVKANIDHRKQRQTRRRR